LLIFDIEAIEENLLSWMKSTLLSVAVGLDSLAVPISWEAFRGVPKPTHTSISQSVNLTGVVFLRAISFIFS
jgi:hypothetical protein